MQTISITFLCCFKVRSRAGAARRQQTARRNELQKCGKKQSCLFFAGPQDSASEVPLKMASGKLSGRLWDPPGRTSDPLNRSPFRPGGAPGRRGHGFFRIPARAAPRTAPERSGAHLGPSWRPRAPRKPPGVHFWRPQSLILDLPGVDFSAPCGSDKQSNKNKATGNTRRQNDKQSKTNISSRVFA